MWLVNVTWGTFGSPTLSKKGNKMNEGLIIAIGVFLIIYGLTSLCCSVVCAVHTIKTAPKKWQRIAGWVLAINVIIGVIIQFTGIR